MEILCKTGHACTYVDAQVSNFYGHVMLGLRIHFLYFSQPNVSKICSFINLCIHPSPFRASGEISQHSPFRCRHVFSLQKSVMINEFFRRRVGNHLFSKACRFLARQLIFSFSTFFLTCLLLFSYLLSFSLLALFFPFCSLFHFIFFSFLFLFLS